MLELYFSIQLAATFGEMVGRMCGTQCVPRAAAIVHQLESGHIQNSRVGFLVSRWELDVVGDRPCIIEMMSLA